MNTPLDKIKVSWDERNERVSIFTMDGFILGSSKDSTKGKLYEEIARRANAYPKLVEALRDAIEGDHNAAATHARELLRELGEGA